MLLRLKFFAFLSISRAMGGIGDAVGNDWTDSSFKHFNFSPIIKNERWFEHCYHKRTQKNCEDKRGTWRKSQEKKREEWMNIQKKKL